MNNATHKSLVAKNLDYLMAKHRLNPTSLASATHQNQPTLHRIMTGESPDPRASTLQPYATYFGVTVNQLRTVDLESGNDINVSVVPQMHSRIPLISWLQAGDWYNVQLEKIDKWRLTYQSHSNDTFALQVKGLSMYNPGSRESFHEGDIILVDVKREVKNGSLVIALLENVDEPTFKKLYMEDGRYYLRPLNPSWQPQLTELKSLEQICGVVFEKQVDF